MGDTNIFNFAATSYEWKWESLLFHLYLTQLLKARPESRIILKMTIALIPDSQPLAGAEEYEA